MPIYEFEYVDAEGVRRRVVRMFKMNECPSEILVSDADEQYRATRVMSLPAERNGSWSSWDEPSDLPPVDSPIIE